MFLQYIITLNYDLNNRMMAAVTLKNTIKKIYGAHNYTHYDSKSKSKNQADEGELLQEDDPANLIDE